MLGSYTKRRPGKAIEYNSYYIVWLAQVLVDISDDDIEVSVVMMYGDLWTGRSAGKWQGVVY